MFSQKGDKLELNYYIIRRLYAATKNNKNISPGRRAYWDQDN
jgi:hypothetical protein